MYEVLHWEEIYKTNPLKWKLKKMCVWSRLGMFIEFSYTENVCNIGADLFKLRKRQNADSAESSLTFHFMEI